MYMGLLLSLVIGWLMGGLSNWVADQLPHWPQRPLEFDRQQISHHWSLSQLWRKQSAVRAAGSHPWRSPLLTTSMALAFAVEWLRFSGDLWQLGVIWLYSAWLLTVLVIDLEHRRVLNVMQLPMAVVALLASFLTPLGITTLPTPISALIGGGAGFLLFFLIYIVGRGRMMGAGDVKLACVIGLMTGYPIVWTALVTGILLGGVGAFALVMRRGASRKSYMAYGPYLAIGALIALWFYWP